MTSSILEVFVTAKNSGMDQRFDERAGLGRKTAKDLPCAPRGAARAARSA